MTDYAMAAKGIAQNAFLTGDYSPIARTLEALDTERTRADKAEQRERELREANDRLMIAAAATVKASMDQYKRGHADGAQKGFADGLEQAARIARAAQYSKTPATDTMRGIERLIDGLSIVKGES